MGVKIREKLIFFSLQITFFPGTEYTGQTSQYEIHSVQGDNSNWWMGKKWLGQSKEGSSNQGILEQNSVNIIECKILKISKTSFYSSRASLTVCHLLNQGVNVQIHFNEERCSIKNENLSILINVHKFDSYNESTKSQR